MKVEKFVKLKLVKLWEILSQETDEEHPMTTQQIISKLEKIGLPCDRRTIYADIKALNECGYEIHCRRGIGNEYFVKERKFSVAELCIMIDAVQSAGFISDKKSEEFIDKLASLAGSRKAETLMSNIVYYNNTKTNNEDIYSSVETITAAIQSKKKVKFRYFDYDYTHKRVYRKEGKYYYINPYALLMDNNNYYFLGYDMFHDNMMHFRVDRMDDVQISRHDKEIIKTFSSFDIKNYKKQLFGMFGGEEVEVTIRIDNSLLDTTFDLFGVDTNFVKIDDTMYEFKAKVQISPQFFGWCLSFSNKLKLISPIEVVEQLNIYINYLKDMYK